jgi:hypothetical protein
MVTLVLVLAILLASAPPSLCQEDSQERKDQREQSETEDLEDLRRAAAEEAEKEQKSEEETEEKTFKSGNLGLQKLNPEISVTGDMLGTYWSDDNSDVSWDTMFRGLGLHLEAYLDPYSRFKAAVPVSTEGAELGEVYFTRYGLPGNLNLTLGKFRQQFGIVNRWHKHGLDWFDFPLALRSIFGPGGLNQMGLSLETNGATASLVHGLVVQVTDGDNPFIFDGNAKNRPSVLGNYKVYTDLSPSTYVEAGLTGLVGWNDTWTTVESTVTDTKPAAVYGVDLNLLWEPTDRMRYRNVEWRSEAYFLDKQIEAPDGSGEDKLNPWGFYSLIQAKVSRTVELGVRYDYFQPDTKVYAALNEYTMAPHAYCCDETDQHLAAAWLTWWQSPFVKFRGGYTYETTATDDTDVHSVTFQMVFAAGPHKHERY